MKREISVALPAFTGDLVQSFFGGWKMFGTLFLGLPRVIVPGFCLGPQTCTFISENWSSLVHFLDAEDQPPSCE